ncbi:hypothetical protein KIL84_006009 [Mauremys mutica]|uniref:Uncharacterized protein n=1 Tax=Mauremys mutica TaxID=74926 RepID=A0A9D3XG47_9SAUR|nr:hypothetical protein KIL84_006009 [Mauremys mutica]
MERELEQRESQRRDRDKGRRGTETDVTDGLRGSNPAPEEKFSLSVSLHKTSTRTPRVTVHPASRLPSQESTGYRSRGFEATCFGGDRTDGCLVENGGRDVFGNEWIEKVETAVKWREGTPVSELRTQLGQWKTEGPGYPPRGCGWRGRGMNRGRGVNRQSEWVSPETGDLKGENEKLRAQLQACLIGKESRKQE